MKNVIMRKEGITIIALALTVVILIIIATVTINATLGQNGIFNRVKLTIMGQKKTQYFEETKIEILEEQRERTVEEKKEAFISSLKYRLEGKKTAGKSYTSKIYPGKDWVDNAEMYNSNSAESSSDFENNVLVVETTDGFEFVINVDNENSNAEIQKDSFREKTIPAKIEYNANTGTGIVESQTKRIGFKVKLQENNFEKEYYKFTGWCKNANGEGEIYAAGSEITVEKDITLYAMWSLNTAQLSFNPNTGTGDMDSIDLIINTETQLPKNEYIKTGYTFDKWTTNGDGTGQSYEDGDDIAINNNTTLYAQWVLDNYNITYTLNSGTINGEKTTYTIEDADYKLPSPERNGYTFLGWTGSNGTTAQKDVTIANGSTGNKSYTANWQANIYTITYNVNTSYGTITGQKTTYTIEDTDYTLPAPTPKNLKYVFLGWTGSNGTTAQTSVTILKGSTGNKTYTANWATRTCSEALGYVTNGLILHYDGIQNTINGHNTSSNTWEDLSENGNNGTLQGGSFNTNSIYLNANNSNYVLVSNPKNMPTGNTQYTIEVYFKHDGSQSGGGLVNIGVFSQGGKANALRLDATTGLRHYYWANDLDISSGNVSANVIHSVVALNRGSNRRIYIDNVFKKNDSANPSTTLGTVTIGKTYGSEYLKGYIYSVRIYRRALSDSELTQNYNIDKARFK